MNLRFTDGLSDSHYRLLLSIAVLVIFVLLNPPLYFNSMVTNNMQHST